MAGAVPEIARQALAAQGLGALPYYFEALEQSCEQAPPPFGMAWYGERFRDFAVQPDWMANSLIQNASKEADGARQLWLLSGRTPDMHIAEAIRQHAIDEARHARYYIAMLDLAFPGAASPRDRDRFIAGLPRYSQADCPERTGPASLDSVFDELVQMNVGEIRTLIHQLLMRPVLTQHCPAANLAKLDALLDSIAEDEAKHIAYTARLIEARCSANAGQIQGLFVRRLAEFNDITLQEAGVADFH